MQKLIANYQWDSLAKKSDVAIGKFTSFINKVAKKTVFEDKPDSEKEREPTLKEKMLSKFIEAYTDKFHS